MGKDRKDSAYSWLIAIAAYTVLIMHGGLTCSVGVIFIMLQNNMDASETQLTFATSINVGMIYAVGPLVGFLTDKYNERLVAMIGTVLGSAGLALTYYTTNIGHLYFSYSVLCGAGFGMAFSPPITILNQYFDKWKLVAMGFSISGIGLGSFIFPPMLNLFEDCFGWRGAFLMLAGINLQTLVSCALFKPFDGHTPNATNGFTKSESENVSDAPYVQTYKAVVSKNDQESVVVTVSTQNVTNCKYDKLEKFNRSYSGKLAEAQRFARTLSDWRYVRLCLHSLIKNFPLLIFHTYLGTFVISKGFHRFEATNLYMTMGIFDMISRPLVGIGTKYTGFNKSIICGITAVGNGILTGTLPFLKERILLYIFAAFSGALFSAYYVLRVPVVVESTPTSAVATGVGFMNMACVPGTIFGAPLAAMGVSAILDCHCTRTLLWKQGGVAKDKTLIYERTSEYAHLFYLSGALFIISGLLLFPISFGTSGKSVDQETVVA